MVSRSTINVKWWSTADNETVVTLKDKTTGNAIGDLSGATISARLLGADGSEIVGEVAQADSNTGSDWATAKIGILFPAASSVWTATGLGHYLQLKVISGGKTKFYETAGFIELEIGF